jgi:hypothetical protein
VDFRGKSSAFETVLTDREFESLLQRSSTIFKARKLRLLKFPARTEHKPPSNLRVR